MEEIRRKVESLNWKEDYVFFPPPYALIFSSSLLWPSLKFLQSYCHQVLFTEKVQISEKVHAGSDRKVQFSFIYLFITTAVTLRYFIL